MTQERADDLPDDAPRPDEVKNAGGGSADLDRLKRMAELAKDLGDPEIMARAWGRAGG